MSAIHFLPRVFILLTVVFASTTQASESCDEQITRMTTRTNALLGECSSLENQDDERFAGTNFVARSQEIMVELTQIAGCRKQSRDIEQLMGRLEQAQRVLARAPARGSICEKMAAPARDSNRLPANL